MNINDDAVVTMTGKELKDLLTKEDKLKENVEDSLIEIKKLKDKIYDLEETNKNLFFKNKKIKSLNTALLNNYSDGKRMKLERDSLLNELRRCNDKNSILKRNSKSEKNYIKSLQSDYKETLNVLEKIDMVV